MHKAHLYKALVHCHQLRVYQALLSLKRQQILAPEMALNHCWKFPCSSREHGRPRSRREPIPHPALPPSGHGLLSCGPAAALHLHAHGIAPHRPWLMDSATSKLPSLCLDHAYLFWVPYHCSHTSKEPQKDTLKMQAWDKSNLPKLLNLSLTLPVIFQLFLNAFFFIRTLSISDIWKIPSYPSRLFAL